VPEQSPSLSRRERQIMDIIYRRERASAAEVAAELPDAPGYSSVRTLLAILERKGHLVHESEGSRYIYRPTQPRRRAGRAALKRVLQTFYDGSVEQAMTALLDVSDSGLSPQERRRLAKLIAQAREEGR
jgi:BlaI family transcriptional regulator, penicillinase repressor